MPSGLEGTTPAWCSTVSESVQENGDQPQAARRILVAGASGYVGGRLVERLLASSGQVRCMARNVEGLQARWGERVETVQADVLEPETLGLALEGVDTAYYLIHSMGGGADFEERERQSATHFGEAARAAGVRRIVYLGGLADERSDLSPHMRSRQETGRILRRSGVPVLEFRASIILGAGSLSFEMIRALVQRLPIMITPRWVQVKAQPIAVGDLLEYLLQALDLPEEKLGVYEIGGADVTTYRHIMEAYAESRGLRRWYLPVPWLSPHLSSLWLGLVTPLFARVGRILIESVIHPSVVRNPAALEVFSVKPRGVDQAVADALAEEDAGYAVTRWSDALSVGHTYRTWAGWRFGTRLVDSRSTLVSAPAADVFQAVQRIGGRNGWYYGNFLWQARGAIDELLGGVGMRRGRRHPEELRVGDVLDCWRVETVEANRCVRLRAEMKLPGRAWLEFEILPSEDGQVCLTQTAVFDPLGLWGNLYWYAIYPLHGLIFRGMLQGIADRAARVCACRNAQGPA